MGSHLRPHEVDATPGPLTNRACSSCKPRSADPGEDKTLQDTFRITSLARNPEVMQL